ncbi:MAG: gamma-glutamylcyclotransferase family protein [Euryarchaeota archaeon]|nr:gamma-glutamylcyclotransferase family protein [Euryarchaeota archaeon]
MTVVFVYGTLTDREQVSALLTEFTFGPSAVCHGLQRVDGRYPTLVPGGEVTGRLLSTPELDQLDRYEGVDRGLYCRVTVPLRSARSSETNVLDQNDADHSAFDVEAVAVYVGEPSKIGVEPDVGWPDADSFTRSVRAYLETRPVRITAEPAVDDY